MGILYKTRRLEMKKTMSGKKERLLIVLIFIAWLIMGLILLSIVTSCKKQPTIHDPHGLKKEPKQTVSMDIGRLSEED